MTTSPAKNRYHDAPRAADFTIDQAWDTYSAAEHDRWDRLFLRQREIAKGRASEVALKAMAELELSASGIPNMAELSDKLEKITGWRVVPVAELVPDEIFFDHLANRRFPAGAFIRPEAEFDYLQEPDIFHDIFGHVPMLADPVFADFMEAYGKGGQRAMQLGQLHNLARLYWYTVEFGLLQEADGIKAYGAGILSGDRLLVDRAIEPQNGDVVVAAIDGELTVKRFLRQGRRTALLAANPNYPSIELCEGQELVVWGVVTFVLHNARGRS